MKAPLILSALALTSFAANAAIIAQTSFESSENAGFTNNVNNNFVVNTGGATWSVGGSGNYAGSWNGQSLTGTQSAVIGNNNTAGHFMLIDADGAGGVGTIEFNWERFTTTTTQLLVQWTTDVINGSENWTTVENVAGFQGSPSGGWTNTVSTINQTGDVKVRLFLDATGTGGASFDDIVVNDFTAVPEPSSTALLGLGGVALILRRRK